MKKVEDYGQSAMELCIKLYAQGQSQNSIMDALNMKFNANLTRKQIEKFLERSKRKIGEEIAKDKSGFQSRLIQTYWDTISQLRSVNGEMYKMFLELRKNPEESKKRITCVHCNKSFDVYVSNYNSLIKTASAILEEIKHVDQILGKIRSKPFTINYNYLDMGRKIAVVLPRMLTTLEKKGIIKIISKKRFREDTKKRGINVEFDREEDEDLDELPEEIEA